MTDSSLTPSSVYDPSTRLYEQIADRIAHAIETGEYKVGERLPAEREICSRLGVSRPSLREALIALEVNGVVEVRSGSGIYVLGPRKALEPSAFDGSSLGPFDVARARLYLEPEIAALAARNASGAQMEYIGLCLEALKAARMGSPGLVEADRSFHMGIAEASGNPAHTVLLEALWQHRTTPLYYQLDRHALRNAAWKKSVAEHVEVFTALEARDPEAAAAAMRTHILCAEKRLASQLG